MDTGYNYKFVAALRNAILPPSLFHYYSIAVCVESIIAHLSKMHIYERRSAYYICNHCCYIGSWKKKKDGC